MKKIIADNLIRYRKGLGLSQEELAELAGITRQHINNYENAKSLPDSKTLSALARALDVTLDDLLRKESMNILPFRFRPHSDLGKKPQVVARVMRSLSTYSALEQAVGLPPYSPGSPRASLATN